MSRGTSPLRPPGTGGPSFRCRDLETVAEYAEAMTEGATFPPLDVFTDGVDTWLADGFHRYHAARKVGLLTIECEVHRVTRRDAVLFSVGANDKHGMRRTNADKRRAVMTLLEDDEWKGWSNEKIARECFVSPHTVQAVRLLTLQTQSDETLSRTFVDRHGNVGTMNTENIGKSKGGRVRAEASLAESTSELRGRTCIRYYRRPLQGWRPGLVFAGGVLFRCRPARDRRSWGLLARWVP